MGYNYQHRGKTHRQEASEKALERWEHFAYFYRTWIPRYRSLCEEKKRLGLTKGRTVPESLIAEYPEIPFFKLGTRRDAADFVDGLSKLELDELLSNIKRCLASRAYREIKAAVYDLDYTVRHAERKKQRR